MLRLRSSLSFISSWNSSNDPCGSECFNWSWRESGVVEVVLPIPAYLTSISTYLTSTVWIGLDCSYGRITRM
jgi:hypothetical protein